MIEKLIDKAKSEDLLFLSGIILNIMNRRDENGEPNTLPELFNTLGVDGTINLIKYFGGETIIVPSHEEMHLSLLVIICYYKKKIENKDWKEIKEELNIDLSPHTLGKLIENIDKTITLELADLKSYGIDKYIEKLEQGINNGK